MQHRVALRKGRVGSWSIAAHRRDSGYGKAAAIRRKGHATGALLTGQVPHQLLCILEL